MKLTLIFPILIGALLLSTSCSHKVVRTGYQKQMVESEDCQVLITKDAAILDRATKVGNIRLGESGFSVTCSEEKALEILKREACSIGAEAVLITSEKRPDFISTCYRCEATFLDVKGDFMSEKQEAERLNSDTVVDDSFKEKANPLAVLGGILGGIAGFIIGYSFMANNG